MIYQTQTCGDLSGVAYQTKYSEFTAKNVDCTHQKSGHNYKNIPTKTLDSKRGIKDIFAHG